MASQIISIPFTGGVNQKIAAEYIDPSTNLLNVVNGAYSRDGTIDKRLGVGVVGPTYLPGDPAFAGARKLLTRGGQTALTAHNGDGLYDVSLDTGVIASRGLSSPCVATRAPLLSNTSQLTCFTVAETGNYRIFAYRSAISGGSGAIYVSVYDLAGTVLMSQYPLSGGTTWIAPIVVAVGAYAYVFFGGAGAGTITGTVLNLATMTWSGSTTIVSDVLVNQEWAFDVSPYVGGNGLLLCYAQSSGGFSRPRYLRLEALPALTITASGTVDAVSGTTNVFVVSCRHDAIRGVVWFAWELATTGGGAVTSTLRAACLNPTTWASVTAPFTVDTTTPEGWLYLAVEPCSPTQCAIVTSWDTRTVTTAGAVTLFTKLQFSYRYFSAIDAQLWGRPFAVTLANGVTRVFCVVAIQSESVPNGQPFLSYLLVDLRSLETAQPLRVVACLAPRQADPGLLTYGTYDFRPASVTGPGDWTAGTYRMAIAIAEGEEILFPVDSASLLQLAQFDFTTATLAQSCEGAGDAHRSGGYPGFYDGVGDQELGFFQWPQGPATVSFAGTSGSLGAGVYGWAICFAAVDNAGLIHRSTFWNVSGTATSTQTATLVVPSTIWSNRWQGTRQPIIELYRTAVNGTVYNFVSSQMLPTPPAGASAGTATVTFTDGASDAAIASNPFQYTTGGILDSVNPPSSRCMIRHVERLWMIDDSGFVVWYSTQFTPSDAVYFNEGLTLQFTDGPLVALAELDANLVVFSQTKIWLVSGVGPPSTGQGSDLTQAVPVPTDVGAIDWRSVVTFPGGLLFQAPSGGLYLFDRGLSVSYVGYAVQDWIDDTVTIVASTLVPDSNQVRMSLSSGVTIAYDYVQGRFLQAQYPSAAQCSALVGGTWVYGGADGYVYAQKSDASTTAYYDTTASAPLQWITVTVSTAAVKPGGFQGAPQFDFVQGIARMLDPCNIVCTAKYDYGTTSESRTFTYARLSTGFQSAPSLAMWRMSPSAVYSQPMSVSITLSDAPPTGGSATTGRGVRWLGLSFSVSQIGTVYNKLSPTVRQ